MKKIGIFQFYPKGDAISIDHYVDSILPCFDIAKYQVEKLIYPKQYKNPYMKYFAKYVLYPLWAMKQNKKYDILHIADQSMAHVGQFLDKKKLIITSHDLIPLHFPNKDRKSALMLWKYSISFLKKVRHIIAISQSTKNDLIKFLEILEDKISVIYDGTKLNVPKYDKDFVIKKYNISKDKFKILCVGKPYYKNFYGVLKSISFLENFYTQMEIIKVGKVTDAKELEIIDDFRNKGLTINIINFVDDMNEVYQVSDLLLFPSLYEGFGLPIIEAMVNGLPVITSDVSSMPEVVGDAGILVNPNDYKEIANAVKKMILDIESRDYYINKGFERVKHFTWEKTALEIEKLYENMLI